VVNLQIKALSYIAVFCFVLMTLEARAGQACKLFDLVSNYQKGLNYLNAKNYNNALARLMPLAQAGLGPAQRQITVMYAGGLGLEQSLFKAALWAELSFRSGDQEGGRLSRDLKLKLESSQGALVKAKLATWKTLPLICENGRVKNSITPIKLVYSVRKSKRISAENFRVIDQKLPVVLELAQRLNMANKIYLSTIDQFDFYKGSRYDRYIGWKPENQLNNKVLNSLRLSVSNFWDNTPDHFAKAIVLMAKRRVYDHLPDSKFIDPLMRIIKGKRVFGSVYPDILNGNYFKVMRQAFTMAEQLPKFLRRYIDVIDEIHYNPISKHYLRSGTIDLKGAFYIKSLSSKGHRLMFVRRNVLFSSPLFFVQIFIHEGTHAIQDQKASQYYRDVRRKKYALARLKSNDGDHNEARKMQKEINMKQDYANRWFRGIKSKTGRIQDIAFECEATRNEIKAVKILNGSPDVKKESGYLTLCPEAQNELIKWQENLNYKNRLIRR